MTIGALDRSRAGIAATGARANVHSQNDAIKAMMAGGGLMSQGDLANRSDNFQAGVTYTRTLRRNDNTTGFGIQANNQFDLDSDWSQSTEFQRDTFRANGIINLPWQTTVGASFFYGSGSHYNATLPGRPFLGGKTPCVRLPCCAAPR